MKKTFQIFYICFFILLILSGCSSKEGISGNENKVRISVNAQVAPSSAVISDEKDALVVDPKKVASLYISSPANSDLAALKYFVNLKYLRIDNYVSNDKNDTYDFSSIEDLPLVGLSIAGFDSEKPISIKSLEPIGNIKSLAILDLEYCQVTSVKDLAGLRKLRRLYIKDGSDIKIEDLSSLSGLTKLGEMSDLIEESREWKFGPYSLNGEEPMLGLLISNGNSQAEIDEVSTAILSNKKGSGQYAVKEDEPGNSGETAVITKAENSETEEEADLYYFKEYSTYNAVDGETVINIFLEAYDRMGSLAWNYSWKNIRPTELDVDSEPVAYDGKVYKEVSGTLYCLDSTSGKKLWENADDVGGGTIIYPYKGRIYITSYYGNVLTCLDKDSGAKIWAIEDSDKYWGYIIYGKDDAIIVGYGEGNSLSAHYEDGRILEQGQDIVYPDESIRWDRASASSVLEGNNDRYGAMNVVDKNPQTAWAEGAAGYGINEWIQIERDGLENVARILISNGYHKSQELYDKNGKLRKFRLDFSDGQYIYYEVDKDITSLKNVKVIFNKPVSTNFIKLTVLDAFGGSKYEDTCITDIVAYSR